MDFKNGVENIQAAGYKGACMVPKYLLRKSNWGSEVHFCLDFVNIWFTHVKDAKNGFCLDIITTLSEYSVGIFK